MAAYWCVILPQPGHMVISNIIWGALQDKLLSIKHVLTVYLFSRLHSYSIVRSISMVEILTAGILILSTKGQCGCKAFIPAKQEADQIVDGRLRWTDFKKKSGLRCESCLVGMEACSNIDPLQIRLKTSDLQVRFSEQGWCCSYAVLSVSDRWRCCLLAQLLPLARYTGGLLRPALRYGHVF